MTRNYREAYKLFTCAGILFNHESPRRGFEFVTRKISSSVAKIKNGKQKYLYLGNMDAKRDWGHAKDYVKAMWLMLQQEQPDDYVVCTGQTHSIRDFLDYAFLYIGINDWDDLVVIDPEFYRPAEVDFLRGDCSKAEEKLGWSAKHDLKGLVDIMMKCDTNGNL